MRRATTAAATAVTAVLVATLLTTAPAEAKRSGGNLTVQTNTPIYTGGSRLLLKGNLGVKGRKRIKVQRHMNRVGDVWRDVSQPGTTGWSNRDGSFSISAPASSMWEIKYRVVTANGKHASPARMTLAKAQEAILRQESEATTNRTFDVKVDTHGADYPGFRDLPAVILPGRGVTIQRRLDPVRWENVATGTVDSRGFSHIEVPAPSTPGTYTYRARLHDWKSGGDDIGWTASFPIQVQVSRPTGSRTSGAPVQAPVSNAVAARLDDTVLVAGAKAKKKTAKKNPVRKHAGDRYKWARKGFRWAFDWEFGQSLTSPPGKAKRMRGQWIDAADGTGRVTMRNGGMLLSSDGYGNIDGRLRARSGVKGSVWSTLQGNAYKRGRWEVRGSTTPLPGGSNRAYRVRYELVPEGTLAKCAPSGIVIAETTKAGAPLRFGVRNAAGTTWARQVRLANTPGADSFAVQVTKKHITWFLNGKPVGTVRAKAALPKGPLTMRISMVDNNGAEMKSTKSTVDWARAFPLNAGKKATSKKRLKKGAALNRC